MGDVMGHLSEKEEARIIAVAEAIGWTGPFNTINGDTIYGTAPGWIGRRGAQGQVQHIVPDYNFSLDAMHETERWLESNKPNLAVDYVVELKHVIAPNPPKGLVGDFRFVNATAAQRFEAFLRIIGKWEV